ncbi:unnamed protein product, partial [marine sediment metagenome]
AYDKREDFTGLMIKGHGGSSEVFVELTEFKPEMDAFLQMLGIEYEDRTQLMLK